MAAVTTLIEAQARWKQAFLGAKPPRIDGNSIFGQIRELLQRARVYRVLNDARRAMPPMPTSVHPFINACYLESLMLGLRRIADKAPFSGPRGVWSLHSLIRDVRDNRSLITRGALRAAFEYEGPTYEAAIDALCGVVVEARSESDVASGKVLERIAEKVAESAGAASAHADKFIAHAASEESRSAAQSVSLTLGEAWVAIETIARVACCVYAVVVEGGGFALHLNHEDPCFEVATLLLRSVPTESMIATEREVVAMVERINNAPFAYMVELAK